MNPLLIKPEGFTGEGPVKIRRLVERRFHTMGTEVRVLVGARIDDDDPEPAVVAGAVEEQIMEFDRQLSRFRADSELSRLNRDPREVVPASPLLRTALAAGLWAAERTGGLVDPTLLPQLEAAGYADSRGGVVSEPLDAALSSAPSRRPAGPALDPAWRSIEVLDERARYGDPRG